MRIKEEEVGNGLIHLRAESGDGLGDRLDLGFGHDKEVKIGLEIISTIQ